LLSFLAQRPGHWDWRYRYEYELGLLCLVGLTWVLQKLFRRWWVRLATVTIAGFVAVVAWFALWEEHDVTRAEYCLEAIRWCNAHKWQEHMSRNQPLWFWKNPDGTIHSEA